MREDPSRILRLPDRGKLFVCTDVHGNLRDFRRMVELFLAAEQAGQLPVLLFTGDLIHGPEAAEEEWPDFLGTFYRDMSGQLMDEFIELQARFPGRVHSLLGNHEHSHVGGPHTPKFWDDETLHFEMTVGPERAALYQKTFRSFPLIAISHCGVAVTHAAPNAQIRALEDLEVSYDGYEHLDINLMYDGPTLARLLWCRRCVPEVARAFLDALGSGEQRHDVVVFGHDIVTEGYCRIGDEQLQLSTSFGVHDPCKFYVEVDLSRRYSSAQALREGREIRHLYVL